MQARHLWFTLTILMLALAAPTLAYAAGAPTMASVGKQIFFDTNLSMPAGQSCATCHAPKAGFADPRGGATSAGAVVGRFGNRNSPSAAYAALVPPFRLDAATGEYVGGLFWDGRADTLELQAKGPFLNELEMNMPDKAAVVSKVAASTYAGDFLKVFGRNGLSVLPGSVDASYDNIAKAIAAYERTTEVNPYSSKYDLAMSRSGMARMQTFSMQERRGMMLFNGKGGCGNCHSSGMMMGGGGMGGGGMGGIAKAPFTDHTYVNLGIPANPANPFYRLDARWNPDGLSWVDHGLGGRIGAPVYDGAFRVPTLRNVTLTAPYGHNGYFATLKDIVHFYNTRDVAGAGWPAPEVPATVNHLKTGNLGLTSSEEDDIVAFLKTLTDGYYRP